MKKLLERQLRGLPENQKQMVLKMVEKNPELMKTIAKEVKEKMDAGQDQTSASMEVMRKYESELRALM